MKQEKGFRDPSQFLKKNVVEKKKQFFYFFYKAIFTFFSFHNRHELANLILTLKDIYVADNP